MRQPRFAESARSGVHDAGSESSPLAVFCPNTPQRRARNVRTRSRPLCLLIEAIGILSKHLAPDIFVAETLSGSQRLSVHVGVGPTGLGYHGPVTGRLIVSTAWSVRRRAALAEVRSWQRRSLRPLGSLPRDQHPHDSRVSAGPSLDPSPVASEMPAGQIRRRI